MRSACWVLLASAILACGSGTDSNGPPPSPYNVAVVNEARSGGSGAPWVDVVTFEVTDKATSNVVSGATVVTQVSAGDLTPIPLVTAANGRVNATWTIAVLDQGAGVTHGLAYCAPKIGASFCRTNLSGPSSIKITF